MVILVQYMLDHAIAMGLPIPYYVASGISVSSLAGQAVGY